MVSTLVATGVTGCWAAVAATADVSGVPPVAGAGDSCSSAVLRVVSSTFRAPV